MFVHTQFQKSFLSILVRKKVLVLHDSMNLRDFFFVSICCKNLGIKDLNNWWKQASDSQRKLFDN